MNLPNLTISTHCSPKEMSASTRKKERKKERWYFFYRDIQRRSEATGTLHAAVTIKI